MTKIAHKLVDVMNELAEVRHVYIRDAPRYELSTEQQKKILKHLKRAQKELAAVEKSLSKKKPKK
jgi:recombinational DNA repair ATPase RecF